MSTRFAESLRRIVPFCVALWLVAPRTVAGEARFFRVVGPTATAVTAFTPDGYITWTNAQAGTNYTIQTARRLGAATNWVDYIQIPASNSVVTHRLYDPNPPYNMVLIPAGSFTMGNCMDSGEGHAWELPLHRVYVSAFYMDRYEVTKGLWDDVKVWSGGNGYSYNFPGLGKAANHPVYAISGYDLVKWCNARSQKENLTPCYYTDAGLAVVYKTGQVVPYVKWVANGYRLPTEAEWEKAARGGVSGHRFPWWDAENITHSRANYRSSTSYPYDISPTPGYHPTFDDGVKPYTSPVGYFAPNGYGLYDMVGNVSEWCWDWKSEGYYSSSPWADPYGPDFGSFRVLRGGSWEDDAITTRCADRSYGAGYVFASSWLGFRCARGH